MTRVVVITGGAGDIGMRLARRHHDLGDVVHLVDRDPAVVGRAADVGATGHVVDLTDPAAAARLGELESVDVLVTAVGRWPLLSLDELTPEIWRAEMSINLDTTYFAVHALRDALRASSGSVVAITSAIALKGHAEMISYTAAKAGVIGLVKALALSLGRDGVRVNAVAPGLVATERQLELWGEERSAAFRATRALGVDIDADDVVEAVLFLGSPASKAVTGQTLVVDGGTVLH